MDLDVKTIQTIEAGKHNGTITAVNRRNEQFDYMDYVIKLDDVDAELKCGVPTGISINRDGTPASKHAKLLNKLGLLEGEKVDPEQAVGKKIVFQTIDEENNGSTFARVLPESVKLAE